MSYSLNVPIGKTIYVDEVPLFTVVRAEHLPFKVEIKLHEMFKCSLVNNGNINNHIEDANTKHTLSIGDSVVVKGIELSAMITRIGRHGNSAVNVRVSCQVPDNNVRFKYG